MTSPKVWEPAPGLLVRDWGEPLGAVYVTSAATTLLCDEAALAVLDALTRSGPLTEYDLASHLQGDVDALGAAETSSGLESSTLAFRASLSGLLEQMREQGMLVSKTDPQSKH